ncbi:phosphatidylinositol mannoside acyltransferase [Geodermatophilus sp. TF02-6]|uniref:phosphatidylinositol mannoside acyltransferase n=1 Tax=Geodermatophilus sp. TF02-6 TaxID=2250575 RepID=UPI000DE8063A|nr:phosphatidylinositol mannoside acyltransferase [Geodermatophilus sp. TF02-6]RBY76712.1 phosphatidylinositol mannoside acyltransferase [Geodermatophilus sp. TF02-6]
MTDAPRTGAGQPVPSAPTLRLVPARRGLHARATARLTDLGFAAGWGAVRLLPEPVARGAFDAAGREAARRGGRGVRQLRANLRVVTGGRLPDAELDALTARAVRSYARYWQEAFRLPRLGTARILAGTVVPGIEHLDRARAAGRGVVLALPHSGNWDAAGVWFVDWLGGPFLTVAERLRPESLYRRFLDYRESLGMRVVPLTGGPRSSSAVLREWLDGGGSACLLVDRDLGADGVPVEFFGRPATMPGGPALLAAQTGASLHPVVCRFTDRGWRLDVGAEVPVDGPGRLRERVTAGMQGVADFFTDVIAQRPEDWHVPGRVWADVPPDPARGPAPSGPSNRTGSERP